MNATKAVAYRVVLLVCVQCLMAVTVQSQETTLSPGSTRFDIFGFEMVYIPTGMVQMGIEESTYIGLITTGVFSDFASGRSIGPERETDVFDTYETTVYGFWVDKYELSIEAHDNFTLDCTSVEGCSDSQLPQLLTWDEAIMFCARRNARLPSEVEWEYAASGPENFLFPWGNDLDSELLDNDSYTSFALYEVGSKDLNVSWVGAFDMVGNAAEWTDDIFRPYQVENASELSQWHTTWSEHARVIRGGAAEDSILDKTTYARHGAFYSPAGVRCVRSSDPAN